MQRTRVPGTCSKRHPTHEHVQGFSRDRTICHLESRACASGRSYLRSPSHVVCMAYINFRSIYLQTT